MLICWHDPAKGKTKNVVSAFAAGCGGEVRGLDAGYVARAGAFYGVTPNAVSIFDQTVLAGLDYFYIDNPYFGRGDYYRVTRNGKQYTGPVRPSVGKFEAFGIEIKPWRRDGGHVLITLQSEWWYLLHGSTLAIWLESTIATIRKATDRPIVIRRKPGAALSSAPNTRFQDIVLQDGTPSLAGHLADAWCVVTHSSNTALEAILSGVPAFVTSADCAAAPLALSDLSRIESPAMPDGRRECAETLAGQQWTLDEFRSGKCWADLQDQAR
jgi:hypothetical protein